MIWAAASAITPNRPVTRKTKKERNAELSQVSCYGMFEICTGRLLRSIADLALRSDFGMFVSQRHASTLWLGCVPLSRTLRVGCRLPSPNLCRLRVISPSWTRTQQLGANSDRSRIGPVRHGTAEPLHNPL